MWMGGGVAAPAQGTLEGQGDKIRNGGGGEDRVKEVGQEGEKKKEGRRENLSLQSGRTKEIIGGGGDARKNTNQGRGRLRHR